jgi:hypothetical protein
MHFAHRGILQVNSRDGRSPLAAICLIFSNGAARLALERAVPPRLPESVRCIRAQSLDGREYFLREIRVPPFFRGSRTSVLGQSSGSLSSPSSSVTAAGVVKVPPRINRVKAAWTGMMEYCC